MNHSKHERVENDTVNVSVSPLKRGLILLLPYILVFIALILVFQLFVGWLQKNNPIYSLITKSEIEISDTSSSKYLNDGEFPIIDCNSCWATLNVDGWKRKDIPVYCGDSNDILAKGAGQWLNSRFCGQNGKIVLSAHVTLHFREIEDTEIGTYVTMNTIYGKYKYQVVDKVIFDPSDPKILKPDDENGETLVMYTCYPYSAWVRKQRIALVCRKVEGKVFAEYER